MKLNGILLLNKERGMSSNKAVNKVKYLLNADKAGHLGTLDVLGEGLLPVTLGKATKLFDYFLKKDKIYETVFEFGYTTDTLDLEGEITNKKDCNITLEMLEDILPEFKGKFHQVPPIYSAKKLNGKKAYELARAGQKVSLKTSEIEIYDIKCIQQIDKNKFKFIIHCSSGTYIRSICRDIASRLNTYGVMLSIIRTKCGNLSLDSSFTLKDIELGNYKIIKLDSLFTNYKSINLDQLQTDKLLNGANINYKEDGEFKAYGENEFLGIVSVQDCKMKFKIRLI